MPFARLLLLARGCQLFEPVLADRLEEGEARLTAWTNLGLQEAGFDQF